MQLRRGRPWGAAATPFLPRFSLAKHIGGNNVSSSSISASAGSWISSSFKTSAASRNFAARNHGFELTAQSRMIYIPCFQSMATRNPIEMPVRARARACVQVDMVTRFPLVPVLVRLDDFARGVNLFSLSLSLSLSLSFPPIFPSFSFFCEEENKRRERIRKKRVFSSSEFLRTFYEVYGYIRPVSSSFLSRAVPSQRARVDGTGK